MDKFNYGYSRVGLEDVLTQDEEILWRGKPKKTPYCLGRYIKLLPVAIIWLMFDSFFVFMLMAMESMNLFFIIFFALHLNLLRENPIAFR